jgi:predicted esterase
MPIIEEPGHAHGEPEENSGHGRLSVRFGGPVQQATRTGSVPIVDLRGEPVALTYVPGPVDAGPYRLVVLLHGAGGSARQGLELMLPVAASRRLLLVAPQSVGASWDFISSGFGPDVRRLDRVLSEVLAGYPVDRMSVGGFSDGASYALSLGLANGDLFDSILAFSPGFAAPAVTHGEPRVFISHGDHDRVLPIDRCSRRLVPQLRASGYDVTYEEFAGGHEVPEDIVRRASTWLAAAVRPDR